MIAWDRRVLRQVELARRLYSVDVIAFGEWHPPEGVRYFRVDKTQRNTLKKAEYILSLFVGRKFHSAYEHAFWMHREYVSALEILVREKYQLIQANDWNSLPVAVKAARAVGTPVLFDAHEYSLTEDADNPLWRFLIVPYREYLYQFYQPVSAMITVADGIRDLYTERFNWEMDIILNAPPYTRSAYHPTSPQQVRIVHHGGALKTRRLEDFVYLTSMLDNRYELYFYLLPSQPAYLNSIIELSKRIAPNRVHFLDPLPPQSLIEELSRFDIGIPLLSVNQSTYFNALPNKFFDFIMSGLAIAVSPLPMMKKIVFENEVGIVSKDQSYQSMARVLNTLSADEINRYKLNSLELAKRMNAETENEKLLNIYEKIIATGIN